MGQGGTVVGWGRAEQDLTWAKRLGFSGLGDAGTMVGSHSEPGAILGTHFPHFSTGSQMLTDMALNRFRLTRALQAIHLGKKNEKQTKTPTQNQLLKSKADGGGDWGSQHSDLCPLLSPAGRALA